MLAVSLASAMLTVNTAMVSLREPGLGKERPDISARHE